PGPGYGSRMRVNLMVEGREGVTWEQWLDLAGACEEHGLEGLFRSDHYATISPFLERGSLDAWAVLAALGARTNRIRLGTLGGPGQRDARREMGGRIQHDVRHPRRVRAAAARRLGGLGGRGLRSRHPPILVDDRVRRGRGPRGRRPAGRPGGDATRRLAGRRR